MILAILYEYPSSLPLVPEWSNSTAFIMLFVSALNEAGHNGSSSSGLLSKSHIIIVASAMKTACVTCGVNMGMLHVNESCSTNMKEYPVSG